MLFSPPYHPPLLPTPDSQGVRTFLNFLKMFFGLVFPGTDECFKQRRYPTQTLSFVIFLYFSVHSIVCVCVLVLAAHFGCIIYRVMN